MKRWWIVILSFLLILGFINWGSLVVGWSSYKLIESKIPASAGRAKATAEREFYALNRDDGIQAGTVAKINRRGTGGVWLWSTHGLDYFPAAEQAVYSYYDVCQAYKNNPQQMRVDDEVRMMTSDVHAWAELVEVGDFIQLTVATPSSGRASGNFHEALAYSQPLFLSLQLDAVCGK